MMYLNVLHDCTWLGMPKHPGPDWTEMPWPKLQLHSPFWGVLGNAVSLPIQNLAPPFFPIHDAWNHAMHRFVETPFGAHFQEFEDFGHLDAFPAPVSGVGLVFCLFVLVTWLAARRLRSQCPDDGWRKLSSHWTIRWLRWAPWFLLLIFMAKVGTANAARHLNAYYIFFLPMFLGQPGHSHLVRCRWWQTMGLAMTFATAVVMVLSPRSPLWPAGTVFKALGKNHPNSGVVQRLSSFYSYSDINRTLRHAFAESLPAAERVVGYGTNQQGLEPMLWRSFTRRVERVLPQDTAADLRQRGISYVVVDEPFLTLAGCGKDQLLARYNARLIDQITLYRGFGRPSDHVYLVRLN